MPVIVTTEMRHQSAEGYEALLDALGHQLHDAPGFIQHSGYPVAGGWQVVELWHSRKEADRFFTRQVVPHLAPHVRPKRAALELHALINRQTKWVMRRGCWRTQPNPPSDSLRDNAMIE